MALLCYRRHRFPLEIVQHAIWLYLRVTLSARGGSPGSGCISGEFDQSDMKSAAALDYESRCCRS
jgi:hypothetical protein